MSALPSAARLLACAALLWPLVSHADGHRYRYDTVHSQIVFSVDHGGYSRPFGLLHIARGWLRFDPDDWSHATTELDIDLASLDMGDADWNRAVLKPAFLDAAKSRYAHFASTSVDRRDDRHGVLHGKLTLRGITRTVDIPFTFNRNARTIFGLHTIAGFSATAMLDRTDFGMTSNLGSIGRHISIWLEIEAIRDDHADAPESAHAAQ